MTVSSLADGCVLSPCKTIGRWEVTRLTPHHTAMIGDAWEIASVFKPASRQASCNYAIGVDGSIVCVVDEDNRSWCSSSYDNDMRAITFELSDCDYDWNISDATLESYINLCVDIIQRYPSLGGSYRWTGDLSGNVTVHRWFAATACPGDPLFNMQHELMQEINRRLEDDDMPSLDEIWNYDIHGMSAKERIYASNKAEYDRKDYSGRGKDGITPFERLTYMAAKQEAMKESIDALAKKVDALAKKLG